MRRSIFLGTVLVTLLAGCWMFEKTDDRPSPFNEAVISAEQAYKDAYNAAKDVPIPGVSSELVAIIAGAAAGLASGVTVLVRRGTEKRKARKAANVGESKVAPAQ